MSRNRAVQSYSFLDVAPMLNQYIGNGVIVVDDSWYS